MSIKNCTAIIILTTILLYFGCKPSVQSEDTPPEIYNFKPAQTDITAHYNDEISFSIRAVDHEDDPIDYEFYKDGLKVDGSNSYNMIVDTYQDFTIMQKHIIGTLIPSLGTSQLRI